MGVRSRPAILKAFGFSQEEDLLLHFPRRHEDRARWRSPLNAAEGDVVTFLGQVVRTKFSRWGRRQCSFDAWLQPEKEFGTVRLSWFNLPYIKNGLSEGKKLVVHGTLKAGKTEVRIFHPEYEVVEVEDSPLIHLNRLTPIYPLVEGVGQKTLRRTIFEILSTWEPSASDPMAGLGKDLPTREWAIRQFHFPDSLENLERARRRMVLEELFVLQLAVLRRRMRVQRLEKVRLPRTRELVSVWKSALPFALTAGQEEVCAEVDRDLEAAHPMNRLLQGDVGSGKTVVAIHAMLRALERGETAAFLAPTETLASQQAGVLRNGLEPLGVRVDLWTRSSKPEPMPLLKDCPVLHVGTHALIQEGVDLGRLGLAVVDEQHKFGVMQRAALLGKGKCPDLLVMTATPIPRTLCLAFYGDLALSTLREKPAGRRPIKTVVRSRAQLPKVWDFLKKELAEGRQAFVVFPVIEENEKVELKPLKLGVEELRQVFGPEAVGELHGRMSPDEKKKVMESFRSRAFGILASTTVIEVGIDVPNATMMVIENAERFGLAQLHQLRGRVGRGAATSYCVLVTEKAGDESWDRLQVLERSQDGFEVAEEDFKQRGPGNIFGTEQSGLPPLMLADLLKDQGLLQEATAMAESVVGADPDLKQNRELAAWVRRWEVGAKSGMGN